MNGSFFYRLLSWSAAHMAWMSMSLSPLALGKESEMLSQKLIQSYIEEAGLQKSTTLGQFWEKTKSVYPNYISKDLEKYVNENKNLKMPEVTVTTVKSTDGKEVPVLRLNAQGKITQIQFFGEKNKWARVNNVNFSENDFRQVSALFKRLEASDIKIKNEVDKFKSSRGQKIKSAADIKDDQKRMASYEKDFARFSGFPRVTPQLWKKLTMQERVGYIVKMRLMWESARQVLDSVESETGSQNANAAPTSSPVEQFYKNIFGYDAFAQASQSAPTRENNATAPAKSNVKVNKGTTFTTSSGEALKVPYDAKNCVVAGYIGAYSKVTNNSGKNRWGCSHELAIDSYKDKAELKYVQEANKACKSSGNTQIACNPIIYGYPKGNPICIDTLSPEFQTATHWDGPCDKASRLTGNDKIIPFPPRDYSQIMPLDKRLVAIEADQKKENFKLTKDFVEGMLMQRDPILLNEFKDGRWNPELDKKLVEIQSQFEEEISRATDACRTGWGSGKNEKNQKLACDQLHRRWLFVEREIAKLRSTACVPESTYVGKYEDNESSLSKDSSTKKKTELNKKLIDDKGTNLCACNGVTIEVCPKGESSGSAKCGRQPKLVNFGQTCGVPPQTPPPVVADPGECPAPLVTLHGAGGGPDAEVMCGCDNGNSAGSMTLKEALANRRDFAALCEPSCDKKDVQGDFNYKTCSCNKGELVNENEQGKLSKIVFGEKQKEQKWVCKESGDFPWGIVGFGALLALFVFKKNKKENPNVPQPPTPTCAAPKGIFSGVCQCNPAEVSACTPGQKIYDMTTCQCTNIPQDVICADGSKAPGNNLAMCPKCSDGSYRSMPGTGRPDGCPQSTEGGKGNNSSDSGGIPVTQ